MPTISMEQDLVTGKTTFKVEGIAGPGCEAIQKLIEEYVGTPDLEVKTAEYVQQIKPVNKIKRGG